MLTPERREGRISNIKYFLPDSVDPPFKLQIGLDLIRNLLMFDGNTGADNTTEMTP